MLSDPWRRDQGERHLVYLRDAASSRRWGATCQHGPSAHALVLVSKYVYINLITCLGIQIARIAQRSRLGERSTGYISAGIRKIAAIAIAIVASIKANLTKSRLFLRFTISIRALIFLIARSLRLVRPRIADPLRGLHQLGTLRSLESKSASASASSANSSSPACWGRVMVPIHGIPWYPTPRLACHLRHGAGVQFLIHGISASPTPRDVT